MLQHCYFLSVMFAVFHNHSPLLTLSRNTTEKTLLNASKKMNLPVRNLVFTATFSLKKCAITHPSKCTVNPLSPSGDQHQFSRNDIHTLSRDKVMRITEMITKDKML